MRRIVTFPTPSVVAIASAASRIRPWSRRGRAASGASSRTPAPISMARQDTHVPSPMSTALATVGTERARHACRVLVAVTDHAAERYRQRVRGTLDAKAEVTARVTRACRAGRVEPGERASVRVRDLERPDIVYVCSHDRPRGELVVVTVWEEGED